MSDLDLFGDGGGGRVGRPEGAERDAREERRADAPLAARVRPLTLEEFQGQEHLLGPGRPLRVMIERGTVSSMILWGPPGSGKTTLARILAESTDATFVAFSAVTEGIPRVREIIGEARQRLQVTGRSTILFCDEIHRFNRAQQDAFLPHVEEGIVVLIGATTENPSFEIVRPLLSRAPVFVLEPLGPGDLRVVLERAARSEKGLGPMELRVDDGVLEFLARVADGDARRGLGILESAARLVGPGGRVDMEAAREAIQHRYAAYDKSGEEHFNLISALHKAVRGSDPQGALYWLARMVEGGEDPLYLARRLVRMATEDIGLADPEALGVAMAARDAYHFLGSPEGELALAEAAVYLATAPKSNRIYEAWKGARAAARDTPAEPVPLHIRNAPTGLMKELGYGEGYRYDHAEEQGVAAQRYLPKGLEDAVFYRPGSRGHERRLAERMQWFEERRREAAAATGATEATDASVAGQAGEPDGPEGRSGANPGGEG